MVFTPIIKDNQKESLTNINKLAFWSKFVLFLTNNWFFTKKVSALITQ